MEDPILLMEYAMFKVVSEGCYKFPTTVKLLFYSLILHEAMYKH